ncbi:COP23 domain-containing protein [Microcoleus sp. PH2017_30_WIL_O_A]|uniref:COP23 domain-containing protein n=1 Tax=Microcoleus sp. PH2017_30_WIL_O_A TaxID=2798840 RepID=UPI001D346367|nr:COP23 domain-containing protein [Microcoleus sp. PH2017_30_WIL_O_A]MCC3582651.1 trypsin-like peptidase domain-containing protein [Microcoleus sp. PH2017_30_WIL_O_A]
MKLVDRLASILIGGVVLTSLSFANIVVQPQSAVGLAQEDVNTIAEQITVMIDGSDDAQISKGSGVIIRHEGNVYYVITNRHVIEKEGNYQLQTVDGNRYVVNYRQIQKLPGLDLAVVQFSSDKNYRVAQLGDSDLLSRRQKIYVVGYATPGAIIPYRPFIPAEGTILERLPASREGYALIYNLNIILPGMSGGPILDEQGRLIGITGLGEPDARTGRIDLIAGIPSNYFRSNVAEIVALPNQQSSIPASSSNSNHFFCGISDGKPATIVRTSRGNIPLILWTSPELTSGFSREQRCEEVSAKLQQANQNSRLRYIRAGTVGERPVLCIPFEINSPCSLSNVLIFLSPGTDANYVLEKLFNSRQRAIPIHKPIYL